MYVLDGWGAKEYTNCFMWTVSLEVGDSCLLLHRFTLDFVLGISLLFWQD